MGGQPELHSEIFPKTENKGHPARPHLAGRQRWLTTPRGTILLCSEGAVSLGLNCRQQMGF